MFDVKKVAQALLENVRAMTEPALQALSARIDDLERRFAALPPGPKGEKGDSIKGDPGKDADPEMIRAEVARAVAALPPPAPGKDGESVDVDALMARIVELVPPPQHGKDGKDGDSVDPLAVKAMVLEEVRLAVAGLPQAKDGEPGRDAAELDILPSIDEAKSYRRGTWASHAGGLIRAARATEPVVDGDLIASGWVVMVEGKNGPTVFAQGEDPREITCSEALTSGIKSVTTLRIPMVIDRGVWREGAYEKGDHVSWDGSGWIAQRANTDKPGTSDAWRLSTKRGRDGKDGGGSGSPAAAAAPVRIK